LWQKRKQSTILQAVRSLVAINEGIRIVGATVNSRLTASQKARPRADGTVDPAGAAEKKRDPRKGANWVLADIAQGTQRLKVAWAADLVSSLQQLLSFFDRTRIVIRALWIAGI
jgi:hypothetical protein